MKSKSLSAAAPRVSAEQVAAFRLSRHHLAKRAPVASLLQVAGDMAGAQAQVLSAAQISLWARTRGLRRQHVEKALWEDRTLAKVWCMRATVHLVPSADFAVFSRGCARRGQRDRTWLARAGRPLDVIDRTVEAIGRALDRPLSRSELAVRVRDSLGMTKKIYIDRGWGGRGAVDALEVDGVTMSIGGLLRLACVRGIACAGPPRGNQTTFVRPDVWLPGWREMAVADAEDELLRRYLRAHGPAAVADFARWTYMTTADTRAIWARQEGKLAPVRAGGRIGWILREDLPVLMRAKVEQPLVRLLPSFDAFLLGHVDKSHLVDAAYYKRVYRKAGWLSPVVLVDGRAAGVWSYAQKGRRLAVRVEPFGALSAAARSGITREADDLSRFLDAPDVAVIFRSSPPR